ncbi:BTAD domain-containing putative transcriptional regulator [Dehalogenimonas alkenigignens]|nr:BTAD domain-containing putative transcriptional regulator [Dehalogenimonas alkenigignens]
MEIESLLNSGQFAEAATQVKAIAGELLRRGEFAPLVDILSRIPSSLKQADNDLGLILAQSLIHTGEVHQAGIILTRIIDNHPEDGRVNETLINAYIWRSAAHRLAGNLRNAIIDAELALSRLRKTKNYPFIASAQFRLGNALFYSGNLEKAIKHFQLALKYSADGFDLDLIARIQNSLGAAYLRRGDMTSAAVHFEHACAGWAKTKNFGALAATQINLAYFCQRQGQSERALTILVTALGHARAAGSKRIEANILTAMGIAQRDLGDFVNSLLSLDSALAVALDAMEQYFILWAKAEMGDTYRRMGQYSKAVQILTEAVSQANEQSQTSDADIFSVSLGIAKFQEGDNIGGVEILSSTASRLESGGDQDALARCYLFLAHCSFVGKDFDSAKTWLGKTAVLADKLEYDGFLSTDGADFPLLLHFAASKQIGGEHFVRAQHQLRKRMASQISVITDPATDPNRSSIEVYAFGSTRVWICSNPVGEAEWRSVRAKELFIYLLCHPMQTADQIMTALWPELSPSRALGNFHTALYRARRATSPGVITTNGGRYSVCEDLNVYCDFIDFLKLSTPKVSTETEAIYLERLAQAINLYRGPFMEGFQAEWIEELRREYEAKYLQLLSTVAGHYRLRGDHHKAIPMLEKAIAIDSYQDDLYCELAENHIALGDRLSALKVYQQYKSTVANEIDSDTPSRILEIIKPVSV